LIDLETLKSMQADAKAMAADLGVEVEELTDDELTAFGRSFERQFVLAFTEREVVDIYSRHMEEMLLGAMIAKDQMGASIDGESPGANKIGGPLVIRAAFLGIGDDWEDAAPFTTGSPQNWIHSGTTLLGGTSGNPIRIGENCVLVVIGVGSLHPSPKIESIQFTVDGKTQPILITGWAAKTSGLHIKEFNTAKIWRKNTTVLGKVFISAAYGSSVTDYPYLLGCAYIKEPQLRVHDAYDLCGTAAKRDVNKVVLTT